MEPKVKVGIVGVGKGGTKVYKKLRTMEHVEISIVCDISDNALGMILAEYDGVYKSNSIEDVCTLELDIIIDTTGQPGVYQKIELLKSPQTSILNSKVAYLLLGISEVTEEVFEKKKLKEELVVLLNSVQEAIEVAGKDGIIQYVNPAFSRLTGISSNSRVGKNIFDLNPDGALARVLRTHEPIYAHRSRIEECNLEVVANASPIIIDGTINAGFVVFQPLTDTYKLMEQIELSKQVIHELKARVNQISTGLFTFDDILGSHPDFDRIKSKARRIAQTSAPILIVGESGTGKEIFAHAIHSASPRKDKPFVKVNCAAIPESLLESELLGCEKYSQGKIVDKKFGKIELASGGTLFLDEVGGMSLQLQTKLLGILQEMVFERLGGTKEFKVDIRVIASTNRNLRELVNKGEFSAELFNWLNGVELSLPPLRKHKEDVLTFARTFILKYNRKLGKNVIGLTTQAEQLLIDYHWPGNIGELKHVIERAMNSVEDDILHYKHLVNLIKVTTIAEEGILGEPMALDQIEKKMIRIALQRYGDSVEGKKRAAKVLNISLATLYNKLKTL